MTAVALTIAGSDSGGGAGIQADLKTFSACHVFGTSALTAVTAQNTTGVSAVSILPAEMVAAQIEAVLADFRVGAIKIGMAGDRDTIEAIGETLARHGREAVLDPVMVATSGDRLLAADAAEALIGHLVPLACLVTPNLAEAALLTARPVATSEAEMEEQGRRILDLGARAVLVKGGHLGGADSADILVRPDAAPRRFAAPRIDTTSDHGTGCTLSAAVAAGLARDLALEDAVEAAKRYLSAALAGAAQLDLGHRGRGPVHHFHALWTEEGR
ncbi:bifunctional hydroxymethylpyrimidine kinase/phosphomethylpyrimidine kinase [Antarcticirhabdus aurantiaca]|uniref:Bifunctional hydroxymethylpyrimidine kinase/phosphomethylpyrimidine kinase n=1 Tax=Antarcticirhabdus aurantiaca TaxID=2606717 RepID=A0ACD4NRR7_9HYPH|nr:bifunctional hydroxymethylpyrimidine kinase/phosphomethylpyrimidine kinase [Antarcticirhabdus aurantiaca]WAJ29366.1 bifunctional hydroxymethylpyrimidine kinase/phosphomethylpyrimidine kinase [Jeongeuplla avenae]